ncbi:hypothetical protein D9M70_643280 [compost metagenome]
MNDFRDLLLNWKSLPISYGGENFTLSDVKNDYITISKPGIDGHIDYTHIPLHAVSSVQLSNSRQGKDRKFKLLLRLISHQ